MGELRRAEEEHEVAAAHDAAPRARTVEEDEDEAFDVTHAARQLALRGDGGGDEGLPRTERRFRGVGDQAAALDRFDAAIEQGRGADLVGIVQAMDARNRARVAGRLDDVAAVASGGDVLRIADLVDAPLDRKLAAGVKGSPPATAAQVRAHLSGRALSAEVLPDDAIEALRAAFPDAPATELIPALATLDPSVLARPALLRWYVASTPHPQLAARMARLAPRRAEDVARALSALGRSGWMWAFHVDALLYTAAPAVFDAFAAIASEPDVAAHLGRLADQDEGMTPADARDARSQALDGRAIDVVAVRQWVAFDGPEAREALSRRRNRERLLAAASAQDLDDLARALGLPPRERIQWLLDGDHVTVASFRGVMDGWTGAEKATAIAAVGAAAIRRRFPDVPASALLGELPDDLLAAARADEGTRRWLAAGAEPRELLRLATAEPSSAGSMCRWIGAELGWTWVRGLGGGAADDLALRVLVLNCPDAAVVDWVRSTLIGDAIAHGSAAQVAVTTPEIAYAPAEERLAGADAEAHDRDERVAELSADELAGLRADPDRLAGVLRGMRGDDAERVVHLVGAELGAVFRHARGLDAAALAAYAATRPASEVIAAFSDPVATQAVRPRISRGVLELFPALAEPAALAQVLRHDKRVVTWLLEASDAAAVVALLAAPAAVRAAVAALETQRDAWPHIPPGGALGDDGRTALERLAGAARGELREMLDERASAEDAGELEDGAVAVQGSEYDQVERARWDSKPVPTLVLAYRKGEIALETLILSLRARPASGVLEHPAAMAALVQLDVSPTVVLPGVPLASIMQTAGGRLWVVQQVPPTVLLRAIAGSGELLAAVARALGSEEAFGTAWSVRVPAGFGLHGGEVEAIRALFDAATSARAAGIAFATRWGATSGVDASMTKAELARLWSVLERVPEAHAEGLVRSYAEHDGDQSLFGLYDGASQSITIRDGLADDASTDTAFDLPVGPLTREQARAAFGVDDEGLMQRVRDGWLTHDETTDTFEVAKVTNEGPFDWTVLHEVGHAVDDAMGGATELIYGLADWREYSEGDFDRLATDLGGWGGVPAAEQEQIRDAWITWLNSSTQAGADTSPVDLVDQDHPLRSGRFTDVGVVALAARGQDTAAPTGSPQAGRVVRTAFQDQRWYTVPERTLHAAPSRYAMTAPAEYFAECYVEYYREQVAAGPAGVKKGGRLAYGVPRREVDTSRNWKSPRDRVREHRQ